MNTEKNLASFLVDYLKYLAAMHYSPLTIVNRKKYVSYFIRWCMERSLYFARDISREVLEEYRQSIYAYRKKNKHPLSLIEQRCRLRDLKYFFRWLAKNYKILYNPASELELPRVGQSLPGNFLMQKEAEAVLGCINTKTRNGLRDRAILELMYSTGIRRMEAVRLNLYDVNFSGKTILIRQGKGKKDRMIPVGERALDCLEKYARHARPRLVNCVDEQAFFLTKFGRRIKPTWLTKQTKFYLEKAGIQKNGSCHIFRHTMATLMLNNGADIRYIQEMLGHAKLETTQIYTKVSIEKLKEVHKNTHPAER